MDPGRLPEEQWRKKRTPVHRRYFKICFFQKVHATNEPQTSFIYLTPRAQQWSMFCALERVLRCGPVWRVINRQVMPDLYDLWPACSWPSWLSNLGYAGLEAPPVLWGSFGCHSGTCFWTHWTAGMRYPFRNASVTFPTLACKQQFQKLFSF